MFEEDFDKDINNKEFDIWLENGIERGWVSKVFCSTHDGDPYMTEEEAEQWEEGGDPCCLVVKIIDLL